MSRPWRRTARVLAVLAAIGVICAPIQVVLHAQANCATSMGMAGHAGMESPRHGGTPTDPHRTAPCCDLCFNGCCAVTGPAAVLSTPPGVTAVIATVLLNPPADRQLRVRTESHPVTFALPPPASCSA